MGRLKIRLRRLHNAAALALFLAVSGLCGWGFITAMEHLHGFLQAFAMALALVLGVLALLPVCIFALLAFGLKRVSGGWF